MIRRLRFGLVLGALAIAWGCGGGDGPTLPPEAPYAAEEVTFPSGGLTLRGTLYLPPASGPVPAVLIVPGSGPVNRDGTVRGHPGLFPPVYKHWADLFAREGIAVLRYDKRFLTHPDAVDPLTFSQEDQLRDLLAAFRHLRSRAEVDPSRVFIVGHSEGGNLAPVAAGRSPHVRGVVSIAAPAFAIDSLYLEQLGANPNVSAQEIEDVARKFRLLREGKLPEGETIEGVGPAYWREWILFSERADSIATGLDRPMAVVQGLADEIFPGATLERNVQRWETIAARSPRIEFRTYAGVTHALLKEDTRETATDVVLDVARWIQTH